MSVEEFKPKDTKKKLPIRRAVITVNPNTGECKYSEKPISKKEKDNDSKI